jgi:undecaprenyl-diphosphatase
LSKLTSWLGQLAFLFARVEIALLVAWIAVAGAIWSFLALGSEMREGELAAFDLRLLLAMRQPDNPHLAAGPPWLLECMRDVTALGGVTLLTIITVISVIALAAHGRKVQAAVLAVSVPLAQASSDLFKAFYGRARPSFAIYGDLPISQSFPSGHSTVATATYFLLAVIVASLETRLSTKVLVFAVAALLSIMIGISRVYLGVHWPSDVIAGWFLGAAWALVAALVLKTVTR